MVIDTSTLIAVLQNESMASRLLDALESASIRRMSAASLLEASIVVFARFDDPGDRELDLIVHRLQMEIIPVTTDQLDVARSAFRRYGKGQHGAALNFGDCFSYALAVSLGEPLLCTGDDFAQTDVDIAVY